MNLYFAIASGMITLAILSVGFVVFFMRYNKRLMYEQDKLLKAETRHREALLVNAIQSAENERKRLAKDIHDELGNIFSTLSLTMNNIRINNEDRTGIISNAKELINMGIQNVRRISHSIMPYELELFGLQQAVENLLVVIQSSSAIKTSWNYHSTENGKRNEEQELGIYRIIQELVSNTLKHAQARTIDISLADNSDCICLKFRDDGKGFKGGGVIPSGIGLMNIESRAILLNGQLNIVSSPGNGFSCTLEIDKARKP